MYEAGPPSCLEPAQVCGGEADGGEEGGDQRLGGGSIGLLKSSLLEPWPVSSWRRWAKLLLWAPPAPAREGGE